MHKGTTVREALSVISEVSRLFLLEPYVYNLHRSQTFSRVLWKNNPVPLIIVTYIELKSFCTMGTSSWTSINVKKAVYCLWCEPPTTANTRLGSNAFLDGKCGVKNLVGWSDWMNKLIPDWLKPWTKCEDMCRRETAWDSQAKDMKYQPHHLGKVDLPHKLWWLCCMYRIWAVCMKLVTKNCI